MSTAPPPVPAPAPAPQGRKPSRSRIWIVLAGYVLLFGAVAYGVAMVWPHIFPATVAPPAATAVKTSDTRRIQAVLFYVSDDGSELVPVTREVVYAATPTEQARRILEAQVAAAPSGLRSAIPAGTSLRALFLTAHGEAYADFSPDLVTGHTGGSLDEALTVFAIVNSLTVNLPDVSAVQILVDGKAVDTLAGHIDLRHPLERSLKWVRKGQ